MNIALPGELETGAEFLARLGPPDTVSCVPGNHDAYVPGAAARAAEAWAPYMSGDDGRQRFPYVRRRDGVALIGVSTAVATVPLSARGRVGPAQLDALAMALDRNDDAFKIVMIHHPPDAALASGRRGLADHAAVRAVLSEGCADLVLHGHNQNTPATLASLPTPRGEAAVIGVPSASSDGSHHPLAGYGVIDIDIAAGSVKLVRPRIDAGSQRVRHRRDDGARRSGAVVLDLGGAQAGKTMPVDQRVPAEKFLDRQRITVARLVDGQEAATHGRNHFGLAADHPALGIGRRQISQRERSAVGTDDIAVTGLRIFGHNLLHRDAKA
ncbi:MAG: hypothetical protein AcusKO_28100 [Acuticoccus sp.]